ncbi:phosphatidylethanolamine-binding protein [Aspergillus spinulosporus]
MPDVTKHESLLRGLSAGTYPVLGISINGQQVTPGMKINKRDTRAPPSLSAPSILASEGTGKYTAISIDIDAPFTSWNVLSPIVHSIQTDLQIDKSSGELKSDEDALAPWLPAGPPPAAAPHRYIFILYAQKPDSSIPEEVKRKWRFTSTLQRMRFDLDKIVRELGLGEVVGVNYFTSN